MFSLLKATGYFEHYDQISETDIRAALIQRPGCVQEWLQQSEDKRTSAGWYVMQNDEGCYEVGYVTERGELEQRVAYADRLDACAAFVKREIEGIRLS
jgi:hypothetical protein